MQNNLRKIGNNKCNSLERCMHKCMTSNLPKLKDLLVLKQTIPKLPLDFPKLYAMLRNKEKFYVQK